MSKYHETLYLETAGTKIRLHLKIDDRDSFAGFYWFPFSTLSIFLAAAAGIAMPEKGAPYREANEAKVD